MMYQPSREQARSFFFDSWRKHVENLPLSALERLAAGIAARHPEYHGVLMDPARHAEREWTPEIGESNPFLHLGLHLAVAEQLAIDQPAGLRLAFETLRQQGLSEHDAEHRLIDALAETLWESQRMGTTLDGSAYLRRIGLGTRRTD